MCLFENKVSSSFLEKYENMFVKNSFSYWKPGLRGKKLDIHELLFNIIGFGKLYSRCQTYERSLLCHFYCMFLYQQFLYLQRVSRSYASLQPYLRSSNYISTVIIILLYSFNLFSRDYSSLVCSDEEVTKLWYFRKGSPYLKFSWYFSLVTSFPLFFLV